MSEDASWPPEISLDRERVLKLLTGDRFYSNASASLREAVLNAIDATYRRAKKEPGHTPTILVEFDDSTSTICVHDNGDGMSRETFVGLFARIGASAAEFDPYGKGEVGEFGIGVVSYFMSSDVFEVETFDGSGVPVGLRFRKEMFAGGPAEEIDSSRSERGTTLRLRVKDSDTFHLLLRQYPHWCRNVQGLSAVELTSSRTVPQGGDNADSPVVPVAVPSGVESARLGPVSPSEQAWDTMTGASMVSILYRGVFVQDLTVQGIWGVQGSVHVDPKAFKPRLDREGFVGADFNSVIEQFLRSAHPSILIRLADLLGDAFDKGIVSKWSEKRFATLWLSVPREDPYTEAAAKWDAVFRRLPAFEFFAAGRWAPASVEDLITIPGPVWIAPQVQEVRSNDLIKSAERLLRETAQPVVRGLTRDKEWLKGAGNYFATTADLIARVFEGELPELKPISTSAEDILHELQAIHTIYGGPEPVVIVALGNEGPPVLRVGSRLLINYQIPAGVSIITFVLDANRGRGAVIEATAAFSPQYLAQAAKVAMARGGPMEILGLVKRRHLRSLVQ